MPTDATPLNAALSDTRARVNYAITLKSEGAKENFKDPRRVVEFIGTCVVNGESGQPCAIDIYYSPSIAAQWGGTVWAIYGKGKHEWMSNSLHSIRAENASFIPVPLAVGARMVLAAGKVQPSKNTDHLLPL